MKEERMEVSKCYEKPKTILVLYNRYDGNYITKDGYSKDILQALFFENEQEVKQSIFFNENTKIAKFVLQFVESVEFAEDEGAH